jgi:hypothetical protein
MAEYSRRRRMIGTVLAGILALIGVVLLIDRATAGRLTPVEAHAALVREFPALRTAVSTEQKAEVCLSDVSFGCGTWRCTYSYSTIPRGVTGSQTLTGEFRRVPFGRWKVMEAEVFTQVSEAHLPVRE